MFGALRLKMPTIVLTVAYNGAPFSGFARQSGSILTVQDELERALSLLCRRPVETECAGRTDAGVHALGQVVSFQVSDEEARARTIRAWARSLNALTHDDISVRKVAFAPDGFSARFNAKSREYRYFIYTESAAPLVMREFSWHRAGELDIAAMNEGASYLLGEHDFKSFCVAESSIGKPTCRNVMQLEVDEVEVVGESFVQITIAASSFLHSMVRTVAGTLVAVGAHKRDPEWVKTALEACDRGAAGEKAPACGLIFWHVDYEGLQ